MLASSSFMLFFAIETVVQLPQWRNSISVWQAAALATHPNSTVLSNWVQALWSGGFRKEAAARSRQALQLFPGSSLTQPTQVLVLYHLTRGDLDEARAVFETLVPEMTHWVALANANGVVGADSDFWKRQNALADIEVWRERSTFFLLYARTLAELGDHAGALARLELYEKISPDGLSALDAVFIARSAAIIGRTEQALAILHKLEQRHPDSPLPHWMKALVEYSSGSRNPESLERAVEASERALEFSNANGAYLLLHAYLLEQASHGTGSAFMNTAFDHYPEALKNSLKEVWAEYSSGISPYPRGIGLPLAGNAEQNR